MICYIKSNIFTVADITVLDSGTCSLTTNTYCRANCKKNTLFKNLLGHNTETHFITKYKETLTCTCTSDDTVINNRTTIYCNL